MCFSKTVQSKQFYFLLSAKKDTITFVQANGLKCALWTCSVGSTHCILPNYKTLEGKTVLVLLSIVI